MNRARRRREASQARHGAIRIADLYRPGEEDVPLETLVDRAVATIGKQLGLPVPADERPSLRAQLLTALNNHRRVLSGLRPVRGHRDLDAGQIAAGEALLAEMLPRARAAADRGEDCPELRALIGPRFGLGELARVSVYEADGWFGDVVFARELGGGLGNALGTSVDAPCATREEAEAQALDLLTRIVRIAGPGGDA